MTGFHSLQIMTAMQHQRILMNNIIRVTLNKKPSSTSDEENDVKVETNDYTHQLLKSALAHNTTPLIIASLKNKKTASPPTIAIDPTPQQKNASRLHLLLENSAGDKSLHTLSPLPSLKPSLRLPNSAPCTPVSKSVHFDNNLENICLFRRAQTPSMIRRGSVFWGKNDDESDSSTSSGDESDQDGEYELEEEEEEEEPRHLVYANWPNRLADILNKKDRIIRVEKTNFRLNDDTLVGKVMVRNLDYQKTVMIRYTFDFWETIENVQAIYRESTNKKVYDVFGFTIDHVPDKPNAVVYFAVYYKVGGQEYWDNNDGKNYEIQIVTSKPTTTITTTNKSLVKPTTSLPTTTSINNENTIDKSILSEPPLMTAHKKEDGLSARYSFGQSFHRAKKPPTTSFTLHHHHHPSNHHSHQNTTPKSDASLHKSSSCPSLSSLPDTPTPTMAMPIPRRKTTSGREPFPLFSSSPTSCHSPLASSPNSKMDLNSQSYMDLVNKYCFYSTSPSRSPMSING
ncbi:carbohydrate-binding module family 21 protein [Backusella circina FSU 941]|nr:carbohydrate-binding module family 21 protein [Backusella circina FSU 941]